MAIGSPRVAERSITSPPSITRIIERSETRGKVSGMDKAVLDIVTSRREDWAVSPKADTVIQERNGAERNRAMEKILRGLS